MRNLDEAFSRLAADSLRRGVRRMQFGVSLFEVPQFAHEDIEFGIGNLRAVQNIVEVLMTFEFITQFRRTPGEGVLHFRTYFLVGAEAHATFSREMATLGWDDLFYQTIANKIQLIRDNRQRNVMPHHA